MALRWAHGVAGASALLMLHACSKPAALPEDGMISLVSALGGVGATFSSRQYEVDGITLMGLKARLAVPDGYSVTSGEARGVRVEAVRPGVWQAETMRFDHAALGPADDPESPRLKAGLVTLTTVRTYGGGTPWRSAEAGDIALLDADGAPRLTVGKLDARWDPVGGDGEVRAVLNVTDIAPRPSWLSSLGLSPCLGEALAAAAPLNATATIRYRPGGRLVVETLTLSGMKGALAATASLDDVPAALVSGKGLVSMAVDSEGIPAEALFKSLAVEYVDAGAVAACLAATPSAGTDVADITSAAAALPLLSDESDRDGFAGAIARFAAAPSRLKLWLHAVGQLPLRQLGSSVTSSARSWYLETTLAVNDEQPVASVRHDAPQDDGDRK